MQKRDEQIIFQNICGENSLNDDTVVFNLEGIGQEAWELFTKQGDMIYIVPKIDKSIQNSLLDCTMYIHFPYIIKHFWHNFVWARQSEIMLLFPIHFIFR